MSEDTARMLLLCTESIVFGALWGLITGGRAGGGGGVVAGAFIGVLFAPFAGFALCRKQHVPTIAIWLGSTTAVALALALSGTEVPDASLGTVATYIGSALIARLFLPTIPDVVPGRCPTCNYDLTGIQVARCPECGHELPA